MIVEEFLCNENETPTKMIEWHTSELSHKDVIPGFAKIQAPWTLSAKEMPGTAKSEWAWVYIEKATPTWLDFDKKLTSWLDRKFTIDGARSHLRAWEVTNSEGCETPKNQIKRWDHFEESSQLAWR